MTRKRIFRWLRWTAGIALALVLITVAVATIMLRASLPDLDGEVRAADLQASVVIERADLGVPTITASNRLDMIYGLGFVHGQDRFFQMDLSRRMPAGELAALFGRPALKQDQFWRARRMRHTAAEALAAMPADQRALVSAYTSGINRGLKSLGSRPPEYWALRVQPQPWLPEDTLLVVMAMALNLTPAPLDRLDTLMRRAIGSEAFDFFYPAGTDWDAALDGSVIPPAPIPGPELLNFRQGWELNEQALPDQWKESVQTGNPITDGFAIDGEQDTAAAGAELGSNAWAVEGARSSNGGALVASDMHLAYSMPGPLYRARLKWVEAGDDHNVIGLTLPGTPALVAGSNGKVAWAPTAAELDYVDVIALEVDPDQPGKYRVPGGWAQIKETTERIEVNGAEPVELTTRWTIWGPIIEKTWRGTIEEFDGRPVVHHYIFASPEAVDLRFFDLMLAKNTDEALRIAIESGCPIINLLIGDRAGKVGWTIAGRLPKRVGKVGKQIVSWADGSNGWNGWLSPAEHPRLSSPEVSFVYSANQRKLGTEAYRTLAQAENPLGARASQIRDALAGLTNATAADMLSIQLDNRALLLEPWREILLTTLRRSDAQAVLTNDLAGIIACVSNWNGRATGDSVGYRVVRGFRNTTIEHLFEPLTAKGKQLLGERRERFWDGAERPVRALLEQRPIHLLNPRYSSYDELLLTAIGEVVNQLRAANEGDLARATWGQYANRPIQHPFSQGMPVLSRWLDASTGGLLWWSGHAADPRRVYGCGQSARGFARPRGGRIVPNARRAKRPFPLALLSRRPQRVGAW